MNILLHGPPGTGKTEFCKVLAERLDVSLYSVGESDDTGDEPVRGERLQELRLAQRQLRIGRHQLAMPRKSARARLTAMRSVLSRCPKTSPNRRGLAEKI